MILEDELLWLRKRVPVAGGNPDSLVYALVRGGENAAS